MTQPAAPLLSGSGPTRVLKVICILVCVLSAGCASNHEGSPSVLSATNAPPQMNSNELAKARAMIAGAMNEKARKEYEDRLRGIPPPPSQFPFPNVEGYAHHPPPDYINFYAVDDRYPVYLQCEYGVDQKNYSQSNEPKWFKAALKQIRHFGPTKFPPIKWIAVIINNDAEWKDVSTIDQAHKVGAIFKTRALFLTRRATCRNWLPVPRWTAIHSNMTLHKRHLASSNAG
jgi:hypothetical protein